MRIEQAFRCFLLYFSVAFSALFILLLLWGYDEQQSRMVKYQLFKESERELETQRKSEIAIKHRELKIIGHREPDITDNETSDDIRPEVTDPIILWWTDGSDQPDVYREWGGDRCFITGNRNHTNNPLTKVFMFYGTAFEYYDLPLPRKRDHEWALIHEESPINNFLFSFEEVMTLFNHTSTFRRESDYPLVTQFLKSSEWLTSTKHLLSVKDKREHAQRLNLAPVIFVNSDCTTASDRDGYVTKLMEHIQVDSYGLCLHNRDLPEHLRNPVEGLFHKEFYELIAKYKFAIAFENAICVDYVTEKIWRPLHVGTIPIVMGSPKTKELIPSQKSAIFVDDYDRVEDLARFLKHLDKNDEEYENYFEWKKSGIRNQYLLKLLGEREWISDYFYSNNSEGMTFSEGFERFVCRRIHENIRREKEGKAKLKFQANIEHYGCPAPVMVDDNGRGTLPSDTLTERYTKDKYIAKALRHHIDLNLKVDRQSILRTMEQIRNVDSKAHKK